MNILFHHRIRSKDGQYVHIEELTRAFKSIGAEVRIVGPRVIDESPLNIGWEPVAFLKRYLPKASYELLELAYNILDYWRLVRAFKKYNPDYLYERFNLYLLSGIRLKRQFKIPMILEVNSPLYEERKQYGGLALDRLAKWAERRAWQEADLVVTVTRVLATRVKNAGIPQSKILVLPNGIDTSRFNETLDSQHAKSLLGLEGHLVIGFVGFMRGWHGLERAVDLLGTDPDGDRHLLLVGDGPVRKDLEYRARRLGVSNRLTITGVVSRAQVPKYIAAFDIALQPRVVGYASPLKLFEYMALGRAIVAPATENIKEILVHGESALLFEEDDTEGFRMAVDRLCSDPDLRKKIGQGASSALTKHGLTWEANARKILDLFSCISAHKTE